LAARVTPARWAALEVLRAVRRGDLADVALASAIERVPPRERPWLQELCYGTLRLRGRLDHLLGRLVHRGLGSLKPDLLDTLRLGAYQLIEMRSVPEYAAVSQAVEMARAAAGPGAGRLANGVLQGLRRELSQATPSSAPATPEQETAARSGASPGEIPPGIFPDSVAQPLRHLTTWGSHPRWLIERWIRNFGAEGTRALVEANNRRPELYLRPVGVGIEEAIAKLAEAGHEAEPVAFAPDALRLLSPGGVRDALSVIPAVVQDPAAGLVVRYAAVPPGSRVADLCAAPGGKAVALAEEADYLAAADIGFSRLGRLRENLRRLETLRVGLVVADARQPPFRPVDAVLIDVPCTGTGTFRRHPDGRWRIGPADLAALIVLQREIMEAAAEVVRPGGLLIYSTCSLAPEQNEIQVDAFLDEHPEFTLEPPPADTLDPALLDTMGRLVLLPQRLGVDGAFAARLRRSR
jgi:16S rRNA (cytosine967-C5)-methyltransferase